MLFDVDDGFYQDSWLKNATITHNVGEYDGGGINYKLRKGQYEVDKPGYKGQIEINASATVDKKTRNLALGQWMFEYESSKPSVATVTNTGIITSKGVGYTDITVTYRVANVMRSQKFTVHVGTDADIKTLSLDTYDASLEPAVYVERTFDNVHYYPVRVV